MHARIRTYADCTRTIPRPHVQAPRRVLAHCYTHTTITRTRTRTRKRTRARMNTSCMHPASCMRVARNVRPRTSERTRTHTCRFMHSGGRAQLGNPTHAGARETTQAQGRVRKREPAYTRTPDVRATHSTQAYAGWRACICASVCARMHAHVDASPHICFGAQA
jgi:hypothetical protein